MTAGGLRARFWIAMCLECVRRDHADSLSRGDQRGPFLTARALGMALGALHDVRAIVAGSATRLLNVPIPADLRPLALSRTKAMDRAAAAACHQVLRLRYPSQASLLEPAWLGWLDHFTMGPANTPEETAGRAYGTAVHRLGSDDLIHARADGTPAGIPGRHRAPASPPAQAFPGLAWGRSTPLAATRVMDFPPPPGRLDDGTVRATRPCRDGFGKRAARGGSRLGCGDPAFRSLAEEVIGIAWGHDDPQELGTQPLLYLQVVLTVLDAIGQRRPGQLQELDHLAVVAGAAVAMADAGIDAWHYKHAPTHRVGRPAVGVGGACGGNGPADPRWQPQGRPDSDGSGKGPTPDVPAYPSGHATFGAAAFQLLRLFLVDRGVSSFDPAGSGMDDVHFDFVSKASDGRNWPPPTRHPRDPLTLRYGSLWEAIVDNAVSRVYLGVHSQCDGITTRLPGTSEDMVGIPATPRELGRIGGVWLGAKVANQIAQKLNIPIDTIAASGIL